MKKLDIMNNWQPGNWVIRGGKVQRIEEFIPPALVVEKEEKAEVEEVVKEMKKLSKEELFALNRTEQIEMLKELNVKEIPRYEADRVKLIMELQ